MAARESTEGNMKKRKIQRMYKRAAAGATTYRNMFVMVSEDAKINFDKVVQMEEEANLSRVALQECCKKQKEIEAKNATLLADALNWKRQVDIYRSAHMEASGRNWGNDYLPTPKEK